MEKDREMKKKNTCIKKDKMKTNRGYHTLYESL